MFYNQEQILQNLKCGMCRKLLKVPTLLPCGETVCRACIDVHISVITSKDFICKVCNGVHDTPKNKKFPFVKLLQNMLDERTKKHVASRVAKQFALDLDKSERRLKDLKGVNGTDLSASFKEYCEGLLTDVHYATEERIAEIHTQRNAVIGDIVEYQKGRLREIGLIGEAYELNTDLINKMDTFINEWRTNLEKFNNEDYEFDEAAEEHKEIQEEFQIEVDRMESLKFGRTKLNYYIRDEKIIDHFLGRLI